MVLNPVISKLTGKLVVLASASPRRMDILRNAVWLLPNNLSGINTSRQQCISSCNMVSLYWSMTLLHESIVLTSAVTKLTCECVHQSYC